MARTPRERLDRRQNSEVHELKQEVSDLRKVVWHLTEARAIEHVVENGFTTLIAQLEPVRDLAPQRECMDRGALVRLQLLRSAMARPSWKGGGLLPVPEEWVPFIGEVAPSGGYPPAATPLYP